jgi:hypothetical protein
MTAIARSLGALAGKLLKQFRRDLRRAVLRRVVARLAEARMAQAQTEIDRHTRNSFGRQGTRAGQLNTR